MNAEFQRVKDIFLAAVEKPDAGERTAYVQQACGQDDDLHRQVDALLDQHAQAGSFLESVAPNPVSTVGETVHEGPGTFIGAYKLLEQIGEGGMGAVWMAEQTHPVRRRVALKVIKPGMDTRHVIARFEVERQALALMNHPNIARVLDAGATPCGRPYFVMELVRGIPITQFCDQHRLTSRQRLELFVDVCQAVQHAHQKGIIHRDLKPSNVLVTEHDSKPAVQVIDFGLAKATGQQLTDKSLFTGSGQMLGTPLYMSPEQAGLSGQDVDTRSDIYSLGVLLYELLTGTTPIDKGRLARVGYDELRKIIREEEPPRPSTRISTLGQAGSTVSASRQSDPKRLSRVVRGELDWIAMRCLEKDRNRRYETTNGLIQDVQRYLHDEPVLACPPSAGYRLRKFARRNRVALTMAALVMGLLFVAITVLAVANYQVNDALADTSKANDELELAKQEAEKANTELRATLAALTREQQETKRALGKERLTLYYHSIALAYREWSVNKVGRAEHILNECPPELRHWEWHYLKRLCNAELFTLQGHDGQVNGVVFSPDGRWIASEDVRNIRLWDAVSGKLLRTLITSAGGVGKLVYSPDSRRLAFANARGITVCDLGPEGKVTGERIIAALTGAAYCVAFSPDGSRLAAGGKANAVKVVDSQTGQEVLTVRLDSPSCNNVEFSPDGRLLATGSGSAARVWDAATGLEKLGDWRVVDYGGGALAFSQDSSFLATGRQDVVSVWSIKSGKLVLELKGHAGPVLQVAFSPDGRHLASADRDGRLVRIWNLAKPEKPSVTLRGHADTIYALAYSPDGRRLASAGLDKVVKVWDTRSTPEALCLGNTVGVGRVAYSVKAERLAAVNGDGIGVWDALTGRELARLTLGGRQPTSRMPVALSPDGRHIVSAWGDETTLRLWDVATQKEMRIVGKHQDVRSLTFNPNASRLASGGMDGRVLLWDAATGEQLFTLAGQSGCINQLAFSPDGRRLVSASMDGNLKIWDVGTGRILTTLRGHAQAVRDVVFSSDGKRLVSGSDDRTVKLWDAVTGEMLHSFDGHGSGIQGVALSPDGLRLAASLKDGSVILWDMVNKREAITIQAGAANSFSVAFSRDGSRLVTSNEGIKIWNATPWTGKASAALEAEDLVDWTYWRDLARSHANARRWKEAVVYYSRAIDLKPDDASCWNARGVAHSRLDQKEKGLADYIKASDLNPRDPVYWHNRGAVYAELGQHDRAIADFSKAIDLRPNDAHLRHLRGISHGRLSQWNNALTDHAKATELKPADPVYRSSEGFVHGQLGQWEKAAAAFEHAVTLKPDYPLAWYYLALSKLQRGDRAGYCKVCSGMLERFDQSASADAAYWIAWTCILTPDAVADWTRPLKLAEKAHAADGKNSDKIQLLGAVLYRAGRFKEAAQRLTEADAALKPTPTTRTAIVYTWFFQAAAHHRLGRAGEAASWHAKAAREMDEPSPRTAQDPGTNTWNRRLTSQLLRREAEELLTKKSQ